MSNHKKVITIPAPNLLKLQYLQAHPRTDPLHPVKANKQK